MKPAGKRVYWSMGLSRTNGRSGSSFGARWQAMTNRSNRFWLCWRFDTESVSRTP